MVPPLRTHFGVPVGFDTDVNTAALGEARWGAGQGIDPLVYLTLGTGVGGGVIKGPGVLDIARTALPRRLNGYLQVPALLDHIDQYLTVPALGDRAGVLGAIALGQQTLPCSHPLK